MCWEWREEGCQEDRDHPDDDDQVRDRDHDESQLDIGCRRFHGYTVPTGVQASYQVIGGNATGQDRSTSRPERPSEHSAICCRHPTGPNGLFFGGARALAGCSTQTAPYNRGPVATIQPFRALRPRPEQAAAVAAVPYDVVSTAEARVLAAGNPLSFLRVSRAEIGLAVDVDPQADAVYEAAAASFARLREEAPLVEEAAPSLYAYRLRMGSHEQSGIAGCFSVDEYERDVIRKHERTRKDKEDDRTRHILALRAQTGPVFLTYPASGDVDAVVARAASAPPLFDFTASDGIQHTIWRLSDPDRDALVAAFARIPFLYIADGHHRAASAMRARQALRERAPGGAAVEADTFLAVAFPDDQMQVLPYHRVVKDLAGRTPASFLEALAARVDVGGGTDTPGGQGEVAMYLASRWYALRLAPAPSGAAAADRLDVSRLQAEVLGPLLDIGDPRTDTRIDFVGGIRGPRALVQLVDGGIAAVAFAMHRVSVGDLMGIADAGGIMPPKSTWFEPKLRDGLLSHLI